MDFIAFLANGFIELFKAGATTFMGWVTGIIPLVVVLMTAVSALIKLVGEERVYSVAQKATKYTITRYTIVPVLAGRRSPDVSLLDARMCLRLCFHVQIFGTSGYLCFQASS